MTLLHLQRARAVLFGSLLVLFLSSVVQAQTSPNRTLAIAPPRSKIRLPEVKLIDETAIKSLLVPKGKPLLVNFWATWCDPCREEFPDLVKLDNEFKGKIDFITISLDDPEEIATSVPKFLASMKAEMPAYLLKTADESTVINSISKAWQGGMPFTILYDKEGNAVYQREGIVNLAIVRPQISTLVSTPKQ